MPLMKRYVAPAALALCIVISVVLWIVRPLSHGQRYDLSLKLSLSLAVIWLLYKAGLSLIFRRGVLLVAFLVGLGLGVGSLATINPDSEIVHEYGTVFQAIDNGQNPYTSGTIFHRDELSRPAYGNFNYPPFEIYPYYLAYRLTGIWNSTVLTGVILILHALCCLLLFVTFPGIKPGCLAPFFPLFLFAEIKANPSMTFLVTALILWAIQKNTEKPPSWHRYLIAVLFGVGLMTKFLIIPFMAAYYWNAFDSKNPRSLLRIAADSAVAIGTAVLIMAPFGVAAVFKNTVLFNLILKDRAALTTFYPNVVSGPLSWLGLSGLYPVAAVVILGLSVLAAPKLDRFSAMLLAGFTFLFVAATPEPQYLAIFLYLVIAGRLMTAERQGTIPVRLLKPGSAHRVLATDR
jgi:hypothetical protein